MELLADEKDGRYKRLQRRHIYLHRLAGDDIFAAKVEAQPKAPMRMVLRFAVYAGIATFVIMERSQVGDLSATNQALRTALTSHYFEYSPVPKTFEDIKNEGDVISWLGWLCKALEQAGSEQSYGNPLSLLLHNRVLPRAGSCLDVSALSLSFRRVKLSADSASTTTDRFSQLYPLTWMASTIAPGQAGGDVEATSNIRAGNVTWMHTPPCSSCGNAGYEDAGGYLAVITSRASGTLVHLIDKSQTFDTSPAEALHHCDRRLQRSGTVSLDTFLAEPFFDSQLGSLTLELQSYNANYQSLSRVRVFFEFSAAGALSSHHMASDTIRLDVSHSWIQYFEYAYLILTCLYFFELVYRIGKGFPTYLRNFWCYVNACSIIGSISCFGLWYYYMPRLRDFRVGRQFEEPAEFQSRFATFSLYIVASSFATFTIYLRVLQFLANTRSRVVLLLKTIMFSAGNMVVYILYIGVIFVGFFTFALTHFSSLSANFTDPWTTFVSTFSLFFGDLSVVDGFQAPLRVPFIWLFMFFFFFLSVQMFNAIINYSYNRVSEDMKSVFQREKYEQQLKSKKKGRSLWQVLTSLRKPKQAEEQEDVEAVSAGVNSQAAAAIPDASALDEAVRQKVEEYRGRDTNKAAKDGFCTALAYCVMVSCYIWFLYVNMMVEAKSSVRIVVNETVHALEVPSAMSVDPNEAPLQGWAEIHAWPQAISWIRSGLPELIFNSTSSASLARATSGANPVAAEGVRCLRSWNCFLTGSSGNATNIVRITQKRSRRVSNNGARHDSTPDDERFIGGVDNATGQEIQQMLVNASGFSQTIDPDSPNNVAEDTGAGFQLSLGQAELCKTVAASGPGSYKNAGGIVCQLDSDPATFHDQMDLMMASDFFTSASATFVVELVTHNTNRDMMSYIVIKFVQTPAGEVRKDLRVFSLALFGWDVGVDKLSYFIGRLLPGVIYMILVMCFTIMLYRELQTEHTRRTVSMEGAEKGPGFLTTIYTFFTTDIFRPVDTLSFLMSFWSFVLFIMWLVKEGDLPQKLQGDYGSIVDFAAELTAQEREYNRISSANLLLIFVRPLRFIREDPRMQRLNQTLKEARTDIFWFIIVLGIVLFACTLLSFVSFGPRFLKCSDIFTAFIFCFSFILGEFDFWSLFQANPVMAVIFFFPYLILVYCVFTNIFFAILDRFFVSADPPPIKFKRKLKPLFSKICRCIDWDDDFVMEGDPKAAKKDGPVSRAGRVADTAKVIHNIRKGLDGEAGSQMALSKPLREVCDMDDRLMGVVKWGHDEAASLVSDFQNLLVKKQQYKNEDVFIKQVVMKKVDTDESRTRAEMEEAHRQMRYAAEVHEVMALRDQQTLAKYIWLLEQKIQKKMNDQHALKMEVQHLQEEMDSMRFTKDELRNQAAGMGAAEAMPDAETQGLEGSDEEEDLELREGEDAIAPADDPNAAMDHPLPSENPTTISMLKALGEKT